MHENTFERDEDEGLVEWLNGLSELEHVRYCAQSDSKYLHALKAEQRLQKGSSA